MSAVNTPYWHKILMQLPLSRTEQEVVKRFHDDPDGRGFLPVADVLRSHKLIEESIELLTQGVQSHPGFAVARVVLARELYQRGMLMEAWRCLDESPTSLMDNALAQKLIFKMALAFGDDNAVAAALKSLRLQQGIDPEVKRLSEMLEVSGIAVARDHWRRELQAKGIRVSIDDAILSGDASSVVNSKQSMEPKKKRSGTRNGRFSLDYELDATMRKELSGYHVVPLSEVFSPGTTTSSSAHDSDGNSTIELDSTTLAEIYAKQEHYGKALGIYRRLLRLSPHNDLLRLKVSELARLEKEQRSDDIETDPVVYDRMEIVEIIDRQMRVYDELLNKLN